MDTDTRASPPAARRWWPPCPAPTRTAAASTRPCAGEAENKERERKRVVACPCVLANRGSHLIPKPYTTYTQLHPAPLRRRLLLLGQEEPHEAAAGGDAQPAAPGHGAAALGHEAPQPPRHVKRTRDKKGKGRKWTHNVGIPPCLENKTTPQRSVARRMCMRVEEGWASLCGDMALDNSTIILLFVSISLTKTPTCRLVWEKGGGFPHDRDLEGDKDGGLPTPFYITHSFAHD